MITWIWLIMTIGNFIMYYITKDVVYAISAWGCLIMTKLCDMSK